MVSEMNAILNELFDSKNKDYINTFKGKYDIN